MTDILLVQPPIRDFYLTAKRTIPYGLSLIAATLRQNGFSVGMIDGLARNKSRILTLPKELEHLRTIYSFPDISPFSLFYQFRHYGYSFEYIGKTVSRYNPFLVGISSLFTPYASEAIKTAETIKKFHPKCKIVLGGHHPTALPADVMQHKDIDYVIRGEAEHALPMLASAIQNGHSVDQIPGIVYRNPNTLLTIRPPAVVDNLEELPLPATDHFKINYYKRNRKGSAVVMTSRGCPMACSYCAMSRLSAFTYRRRTVKSIMEEINQAVTQFNTGFIDFEDENLSLDKKQFIALLNEIIKNFRGRGPELRAMNGLFSPTLDEEVIHLMQKAGFKTLNLSIGSISKTQLKRFNRPDIVQSFEHALHLSEKFNLTAVAYIIAGAPFQNPMDSIDDLLYLASRRTLSAISIYYPSPGSRDWKLCQAEGLLPASYIQMRASAFPLSHTTRRLEAATILRLGRILNFMKSLIDTRIPIPTPEPFLETRNAKTLDRVQIGLKLLQWFLNDGKVRGATSRGEIITHETSTDLVEKFLTCLPDIRIRGSLR